MTEIADEQKLHFLDYWRVIRIRMPLIILVFLLVIITAVIVTFFMPKKYTSAATIEVQEPDAQGSMKVFQQNGGSREDPRFSTTQFQIIQKKEVLYRVIESLNLTQKWGVSKEEAYMRLTRHMLKVSEVRNTDLIQIMVSDTDPQEASDIANTVALEYTKRRVEELKNWMGNSLAQLKEEVDKQKKKEEELHDEATRIRTEEKIIDLNPETMEETSSATEKLLPNLEEQVSNERMRVSAIKTKLDKISRLTDEEIIQSNKTLEIEDPLIAQIYPLYQESAAEEARLLNGGLGPNHPNVKSLRAKMAKYKDELKQQVASLRKTLETNLEIAQQSQKNFEKQLQDARNGQQSAKTLSENYASVKNSYILAKKLRETAEMRLTTEAMQNRMPTVPAIIWEHAEPSYRVSSPNWIMNISLGAFAGIIFGLGLAFFIEYLDTSVKTMEDVEIYLGVPVLAIIPKNISLLLNEAPDHPDAEAYRILRTNVEFNRKSPDANTLTIVSGGTGEGKSTTLCNLAYTFARGGYNTLVVDADLRRPSQHRLFNVGNETGLTNYLTTDLSLEEVILPTPVENLYLLPSGKLPLDAVGILNSQRMVEMISELKSRFDMVFFDSPPILGVSDASVLVNAVDLAIIVVQHRRFPRMMLQKVKQAIMGVGGTILGVVLNNVDIRHDHHYEYYTSYYSYYSQPVRKADAPKKTKAAEVKKEPRESGGGEY